MGFFKVLGWITYILYVLSVLVLITSLLFGLFQLFMPVFLIGSLTSSSLLIINGIIWLTIHTIVSQIARDNKRSRLKWIFLYPWATKKIKST